jgi:hypothetical protein
MDAQGEADSQLDAQPANMAPFAVREKDGTIVPYLEKLAEREAAAAEGRTAYLLGAKGDRDLDAMERAGTQLLDDLAGRKVGPVRILSKAVISLRHCVQLAPLGSHTPALTQTYVSRRRDETSARSKGRRRPSDGDVDMEGENGARYIG